jgi:hypothetical protein
MMLPQWTTTVAIGPLVGFVLVMIVKHVLADFILQTQWMALGKDGRTGWALPLLVHCSIHGLATTAIVLVLEPRLWFLGLVDFAIHLICDRAKGFAMSRLSLSPANAWFWWLLGIDQALHHTSDFVLALILTVNA